MDGRWRCRRGRRRCCRCRVARQGRATVRAEAAVGRIPSAAAHTALLARGRRDDGRRRRELGRCLLGRNESERWRCRTRPARCPSTQAVGQMHRRWQCGSRGWRRCGRIQAIPTILAELETVRVVPAAAAAVHDVEASSAVRTEFALGVGRYPTRPATATNAYQRARGSRASITTCTASQCAMPNPSGPSARVPLPKASVKRRKRTG